MASIQESTQDMVASSSAEPERIELSVSPDQKSLIERAAEQRGLSLMEYVRDQLLWVARADVDDFEVIQLSDRDRDLFLDALDHPPEPNDRLRRIMSRDSNVEIT